MEWWLGGILSRKPSFATIEKNCDQLKIVDGTSKIENVDFTSRRDFSIFIVSTKLLIELISVLFSNWSIVKMKDCGSILYFNKKLYPIVW